MFIALMSMLLPFRGIKRDKVALLTLVCPRLLIGVCAFWRDLTPDQCRRETSPRGAGSSEDVVEEELGEEQHTEDETVTAR